MFTKLNDAQIQTKIDFFNNYLKSENSADASLFDANANVSNKNIATLETEINKDINIQINRKLVYNKIENMFDTDLANEYLHQIKEHEIYVHDETSLKPYCVSISMYPFLIDGLKSLGGESGRPEHIESFCGSFVNLIFAIASQFAGAVATVEFLMYFDHFARKDYGDDYLNTHRKQVKSHLQHVVYCLNQPAAARGYQSVFWNISVYDEYYFNHLFGEAFVFPDDNSKPQWESLKNLQNFFMDWFNEERKSAVLTYPVVTAAMLSDNETEEIKDKEFAGMLASELTKGNSFFMYISDSADSLSSCCRLRSELSDNVFSYSLGAGGVSTGSVNVITMNLNRIIQKGLDIGEQVDKIHKYHLAYREILKEFESNGLLPVYTAGYISFDKQFSTVGINGLVEAAEFLDITIGNNAEYKEFVDSTLKIVYDKNKEFAKNHKCKVNTEMVPAENLGVKNAKWDTEDGLKVSRECYNSYFYVVEDDTTNVHDKFVLHGKDFIKYLDGGSALHLNLEELLTKEQYLKLLNIAAKQGCNYFCTNVKITICNSCEHIDKRTLDKCSKCDSSNIDHATRVIGYLKRIKSFNKTRKQEENLRFYSKERKAGD